MSSKAKIRFGQYSLLDVFTTVPFAGNQLAVVRDSSDLSSDQMQKIAKEFNLSETVFILPATNKLHKAKIRIFTPESELDFAGHPTIGSAIELAACEWDGKEEINRIIILEENIGAIRCAVKLKPEAKSHSGIPGLAFAEFDIPQMAEKLATPVDIKKVAAALAIDEKYIGFGSHKVEVWTAGAAFTFVPVANKPALSQARVMLNDWHDAFDEYSNVYVYCLENDRPQHDYHARMFAPDLGVMEDPATGSAAAAFSGVIASNEPLSDGLNHFVIEQGYAMARPSQINLGLEMVGGNLNRVSISGYSVRVAKGNLFV